MASGLSAFMAAASESRTCCLACCCLPLVVLFSWTLGVCRSSISWLCVGSIITISILVHGSVLMCWPREIPIFWTAFSHIVWGFFWWSQKCLQWTMLVYIQWHLAPLGVCCRKLVHSIIFLQWLPHFFTPATSRSGLMSFAWISCCVAQYLISRCLCRVSWDCFQHMSSQGQLLKAFGGVMFLEGV